MNAPRLTTTMILGLLLLALVPPATAGTSAEVAATDYTIRAQCVGWGDVTGYCIGVRWETFGDFCVGIWDWDYSGDCTGVET